VSVIDEVKSRLDIVDIITESVTLKKSGQSYTGFCPFHSNTKTPSFVVFPHTQTWRCFGACAEGGDLFSFIMKREGCDFKEALTLLAHRAGVVVEPPTPEATQQEAVQHKLFELNAAAALYFHQLLLNSSAAATTRQYIAQRTLTTETIATFQMGYALHQRDALKQHFMGRGYSEADLIAVGLLIQPDDGSESYDRFRHRLMIPIRNPKGQVIGFGARALANTQQPKYLNSPQTALFDKSATLFGLDLAKQHIHQKNQVIIVEGYMDVIQAYQRGARNVVAQMGTAFTEPQLKLVAGRHTQIVLALDSDAAGNAATLRSLSLARQWLPKKARPNLTTRGGVDYEAYTSQELYVAALPQGQDPDDVLKQGLAVWQKLIDQAMPALDFYEQIILKQTNLQTPQGKAQVVHELMPLYREIEDEVEKTARVQQLARKIGLDERLLIAELKNNPVKLAPTKTLAPQPVLNGKQPAPFEKAKTVPSGLEEYCLAIIITQPTTLVLANEMLEKHRLASLTMHDFNQADNKEIFRSLELWTVSEVPRFEILLDMVGELFEPKLKFLLNHWHRQLTLLPLEQIGRGLISCIIEMRASYCKKNINEVALLQQEMQLQGDYQSSHYYGAIATKHIEQLTLINLTQKSLSISGQILARTNNNNKPLSSSRLKSY